MESSKIRQAFLDFFASKSHQIVPSAPIVNKNDPTLLFTNSGMNQFKDIFTGDKPVRFPRIADTQKCLRVSGKHNDLEDVGLDTYHHTMFEMLGNWSFGDYFKEEAIAWAWEFLTEVLYIDKNKLYVTVFEGNEAEKTPKDGESIRIWKKYIEEDRILPFGKKENFWEMGDTGPCGPCTEIHIDLRTDTEKAIQPGKNLVNQDHPQVIEIWNVVFMQFYRKADKSLTPLEKNSVDTGMGFERLVRVIQNKTSNYDTDIFTPILSVIEKISGLEYGKNESIDIAMRVIMDHIRAIAFAIADGQLPSNTGAGYVIRRVCRRATRYAYQFLNLQQPFLYTLVPILSDQFKTVFPELHVQENFVAQVIMQEEKSFLIQLEKGLKMFEHYLIEHPNIQQISGEFAFELYDTFGFPYDLTVLLAKDVQLTVDDVVFNLKLAEQKERSRNAAKVVRGDWVELQSGDLPAFVGYDNLSLETEILKYREISRNDKPEYHIVIAVTPFYAESGGQVGDTGWLIKGDEKIQVCNTIKENELIVLITNQLPVEAEGEWLAIVDAERRKKIQANHSATHLLHAALRETLGTHVEQRGSLVNDEMLRFDFSHFQKLTTEELQTVENRVNQKIAEGILLKEYRDLPIAEAKKLGAMALFGEKYGELVRVIQLDSNYSTEFCGGCHVSNTLEIRLLKIISEGSTSSGTRRIEAVTGVQAIAWYENQVQLLAQVKETLKNPQHLLNTLEETIEKKKQTEEKLQKLEAQALLQLRDKLLTELKNNPLSVSGLSICTQKVEVSHVEALKTLSFELRKNAQQAVFILACVIDEKPLLSVIFSEDIQESEKNHAGKIIKEMAKFIQGGGGGQWFYATAGGKNIAGIDAALQAAQQWFH